MLATITDNLPTMIQATVQNSDHRPAWRHRWGLVIDRATGNVTVERRTAYSPRNIWIGFPRVDAITYGLPAWLFGPFIFPEDAEAKRLREDAARAALGQWAGQIFAAIGPALASDQPDVSACHDCGRPSNPIVAVVDVHLCPSCYERTAATTA